MNLIETIEESLGMRLKEIQLNCANVSNEQFEILWYDLDYYYDANNFSLKTKANSIRPYLSPFLARGLANSVGFDLAFKTNPHDSSCDIPNSVKKYLLYAESICIHDPLPYHLDYFLQNKNSDLASKHRPMIHHLLNIYEGIRDLIEHNIVIPLSDTVFHSSSEGDLLVDDDEMKYICKGLCDLDEGKIVLLKHYASILKNEIRRRNDLSGNIDIALPNESVKNCYIKLLEYCHNFLTKKEMDSHFYATQIASISTINTSKIKIQDIINVRKNEESFELWRKALNDILHEYYSSDYQNNANYFSAIAKEQLFSCNKLFDKSQFLRNQGINLAKDLSVGLITGGIVGLLSKDFPNSLISAGVSPIIPIIIKLFKLRNMSAFKEHYFSVTSTE